MPSPIPQPQGLPILGNIFDMIPGNTWASLNKLAAEHGGAGIFKIKILTKQLVFITNAALLGEICDEKRFRKCVTGPIVEIRNLAHDSLFTAFHNEESWGIAHRIMAPFVLPEAVKEMHRDIQLTTDDLIWKWTSTDSTGQPVDVSNDLDRLNHAANMKCFFSQHIDCVLGEEPAVIKAMSDTTFEAMRRPTRPRLLTRLLYQSTFDRDIKICRDYCAQMIANRRAKPGAQRDLLHALLYEMDPKTGESLPDSRVIDEIINILIGSATAPNLVAFTLYYLAKHPDEITRARQEIDTLIGPSGQIEHFHLSQLPYCEAILRESFRLCATAPGFNIEPLPTDGPVLLGGGKYEISKTQPIIAILSAVNRDPAVFDDPNAFKPERMLGEAFDRLPSGVKKGFGNGKRECYGKRYAWEWCLHALIRIIKDVDFELADKEYTFDMEGKNFNGAFSVKPYGMFIKTKKRNSAV
ncbi:Cytochrome P450 [Penicillium cf. griseofulvum]|uniref:Self-sufficient cytochrome P450 monooxygenase CYP505E4 n=1 Tax=Penicillium cf. griseofulvum TaxID=2972120 RepID=A0A9W9T1S6_9EURO|nr:Cytochrome P450 [Penicillium cf. griseofulvum]KAJ5440883.1 Cytochrome P450 [Penicillium cf. griseofulvum]KAJ5448928.1 Cytochrome P450 [Penicillium cf. griseofulvum]